MINTAVDGSKRLPEQRIVDGTSMWVEEETS